MLFLVDILVKSNVFTMVPLNKVIFFCDQLIKFDFFSHSHLSKFEIVISTDWQISQQFCTTFWRNLQLFFELLTKLEILFSNWLKVITICYWTLWKNTRFFFHNNLRNSKFYLFIFCDWFNHEWTYGNFKKEINFQPSNKLKNIWRIKSVEEHIEILCSIFHYSEFTISVC